MKVLYLEDDPLDVKLVRETLLAEGVALELTAVDAREDFTAALRSVEPDIILADYRVPGFDGSEALAVAQSSHPETPFIFFSGAIGEEQAVGLLKQGATDYVLKDRLPRLAPAMRRALAEAEQQRRRREADREVRESNLRLTQVLESLSSQLERLFENRHVLIAHLDARFTILRVNRAFAEAHGKEMESFAGRNYFDVYPSAQAEAVFRRVLESGDPYSAKARSLDLFGPRSQRGSYWDWSVQPVRNESGRVEGLLLFLLDVTRQKKAQKARVVSERRFKQLVENLDSIILRWKPEGGIAYANALARDFFDLPEQGAVPTGALGAVAQGTDEPAEDCPPFARVANMADGPHKVCDCEHRRKNGSHVWVRWTCRALMGLDNEVAEVLCVGADITDQKLREQEMERAQQRLRAFARTVGTALHGRAVSPGLAEGAALLYWPIEDRRETGRQIAPQEVETELSRFDRALETSVSELEQLKDRVFSELAEEEMGILEVHLALLKDGSFVEKCKRRVRDNFIEVEQAVTTEITDLEGLLQGLGQEFARERSADVRDIGRRVLWNLRPEEASPASALHSLPPGTVLVAEQLLPSDTLELDRRNVVAFVTEKDGPASHAAILARAMGIPAIADVRKAMTLLSTGDRLLVDAETGTITVAPTRKQAARFAARKAHYRPPAAAAEAPPSGGCVTRDGTAVSLHANIGRTDEARLVIEYGLEGVGLFRSEFLFLEVDRAPDLDAQRKAYAAVAGTLQPRPVVIRTMDLGGDKIPRFVRKELGDKPHEGKRGLAYSLSEKKLFRVQMQAILRACESGNARIMFPMVTGVADLREARSLLDGIIEQECPDSRPPVGAMIETPAAVFAIDEILQIVDFVSIGTNDLAHFTLAVERESREYAGARSLMHPSVLRATERVVRAAQEQDVGLAVCGEAAGEPATAYLLVGLGVRELSMGPFLARPVRQALSRATVERAELCAREALGAATIEEVETLVSAALRENGIEARV